MDVNIQVTHAELARLGMNKDQLYVLIARALDNATTNTGESVNLNHTVNVEFSKK